MSGVGEAEEIPSRTCGRYMGSSDETVPIDENLSIKNRGSFYGYCELRQMVGTLVSMIFGAGLHPQYLARGQIERPQRPQRHFTVSSMSRFKVQGEYGTPTII